MGEVGLPEILLILVIVLIFFGGRKIPELMRGLGEGVRSFKEGLQGREKPSETKPPGEHPRLPGQ